jgi:putative acetyltransferase
MHFAILDNRYKNEVTSLFCSVFSSSEGEEEGKLIGRLAADLAENINNQEIICIGAIDGKSIAGVIFFTRLQFEEPVQAYMLAPVAVSTAHQSKGIGQALIQFGLEELKNRDVTLAITYGDPAFYSKVGFKALSLDEIQAPRQPSMPEGWLGQSLSTEPTPILLSRPTCVHQFDNPDYW